MSRRTERVRSLIQAELSRLVLMEVSDPTLANVSITDVEVAPDLKVATVYFVRPSFGDTRNEKISDMLKGFKRATPFLRHSLGKKLEMRQVPDLKFVEDNHAFEVANILNLIEKVGKEKKELEKGTGA